MRVLTDNLNRIYPADMKMVPAFAAMILGSALATAASGADNAVRTLEPIGKWGVDDSEVGCVASREFGDASSPDTLGFRLWPMASQVEAIFISKHGTPPAAAGMTGKLRITTDDGQSLAYPYWQSGSIKVGGEPARMIEMSIDIDKFKAVQSATNVTLTGSEGAVTFHVGDTGKLWTVMEDCRRAVLKSWGVDLALPTAPVDTAKPVVSPASWFDPNDYPPQAKAKGASARLAVLVGIGADGRVTSCKQMGPPVGLDFESVTCALFAKHGRYRPAHDTNGAPTLSYQVQTVRWLIFN